MSEYVTKDSGERAQFDSGMQRDTEAGKPRFDLTWPEGVPFGEQLLVRFAKLMGRGAEKYTERNWESANSEAEIKRMKSSAWRHFMQWYAGDRDEDHAAAVIFNLMAAEATEYKLHHDETEELDEIADQILASRRGTDQGATPAQEHLPPSDPGEPLASPEHGAQTAVVPGGQIFYHSTAYEAPESPSRTAQLLNEAFELDRRSRRGGGIPRENLRF